MPDQNEMSVMLHRALMTAGLRPWVCSYEVDGLTWGIILYATDPDQIEEDFKDDFQNGIVVDGLLVEWINL